jgi:hypothetical protein
MRHLFCVTLFASGCAGWAEIRAGQQVSLRKRAAFDFQCPADQLQLEPIEDHGPHSAPTQYGVAGCGQRGAYINTWPEYESSGNWVLDSTSTKPADKK